VHIETVFSKRILTTNCLVLTSDYPYISISPPRGTKNVSVNITAHRASMALLMERVQYYILLQIQHIQDLENMLKGDSEYQQRIFRAVTSAAEHALQQQKLIHVRRFSWLNLQRKKSLRIAPRGLRNLC